ncbi:M23 family metallopeptidase [Sulfurimonas sp. SAG-AH-194-I05]|nr:M23 family metallopeptidase [Sulfurimonas sp. SAG-AH-194-I05]MDF1875421.1 M23 family metallopeptidase [Sulfurimonas sp. SAG-AH-194-I05]
MRFLSLFLILATLVFAKNDIDKKINSTTTKINSFDENYTSVNKKMAKNAKDILKQKQEIEKQKLFLKKLKYKLLGKETTYQNSKKELTRLIAHNKNLKSEQNTIEEELVFVIAQSVSLSIILEGEYSADEESLMEFEILQEMLKSSKKKAAKLNTTFYANAQKIKKLNLQKKKLKKSISIIDQRRKKIISVQTTNKNALTKLQGSKALYKKKLQALLSQHSLLKKTLAKLNIIKIDTIEKEKQLIRKAEAKAKKKSQYANKIILDDNLPKVKQHGTSYQALKTKKYRGVKTISPLDSYTITKKYGTYTDPIYGIKIFNESISLKPKKKNAKVKTVFNGKVIYADKTAVLNNIVIVEHRNGLHTIYANLSRISPNIAKGKKIKKGYVIGRVNEELIFEVTQKSFHINPIRLFK